jgi:hypothetical protein
MEGTSGCRHAWSRNITFTYETGGGLLAVGVLGGGKSPLYMRPVGGTCGCWHAWSRNITFMYDTGGMDFWLSA